MKPPAYDTASAGDVALETYDADGNGQIDENELAKAPGLKSALADYDTDGDGQVSSEEVQKRVSQYAGRGTALMRITATVRLGGKPLAGAEVKFIPEPFLGDEIKAAVGKTNDYGKAAMMIPDDQLPEEQRGIGGVQLGAYRVEITHPETAIPAKYNTESTLGYESRPGQRNVDFDLKKR